MIDPEFRKRLGPLVRTLQIIVVALVLGSSSFLGVVLVLSQDVGEGAGPQEEAAPVVTYMALAFMASAIVAALIVPRLIVSRNRETIAAGTWRNPHGTEELIDQHGDAARLWMTYMTRTIVGAALLEGAAFFALIAFLIERSPLAIAAAVVLIVAIAAHLPTYGRVVAWLEDQLHMLHQERELKMLSGRQ